MPGGQRDLGDLVLCVPYVVRFCEGHEVTFERRVTELVVHGMCHLLGHEHDSDAGFAAMLGVEKAVLGAPLVADGIAGLVRPMGRPAGEKGAGEMPPEPR